MRWRYREGVKWDKAFDELKPGEYFVYDMWCTVLFRLYDGYYVDGSTKYVQTNYYPYWIKRVYPVAVEDGDIIFLEEKPIS